MVSRLGRIAAISVSCLLIVGTLWAQRPQVPGRPVAPKGTNKTKAVKEEENRVDDPRLIDIHKQFVGNVEKLAAEYEKTNQLEKARHCYEQILRLIPQYKEAEAKLNAVKDRESVAETRKIEVFANKDWQDTGVIVGDGKPVSIKAAGKWKFQMQYDLTPDGIEIPRELRDFNIGSLVGRIITGTNDEDDGKVFFVGSSYSFTAKQIGRLQLRIYDANVEDNSGKLQVEISGSFEKK